MPWLPWLPFPLDRVAISAGTKLRVLLDIEPPSALTDAVGPSCRNGCGDTTLTLSMLGDVDDSRVMLVKLSHCTDDPQLAVGVDVHESTLV
jgi:hypothetical protein